MTGVRESFRVQTDSTSRPDEVGLLRLATIGLKRWRLLLLVPFVAALIMAIVSFFVPSKFTATSTFVPEIRGQTRMPTGLGSLAGLASQFGVSVGADPSQSPRFYAKVAESREILERILLTRFLRPSANGSADSATLLVLFGVKGRDRSDSLYRGLKKLRRQLSVSVDNQTNVVTISVETSDGQLAASVTNKLVAQLNEFNSQVRRSQARERRIFVENRVTEGEKELRHAEQALKTFYERNRSWQQSPQLVYEEGRMRREVEIRQEVYVTLQREYETARIEEVNDVPLITVIDAAVRPAVRSWPKRAFLVILTGALAAIASFLWVAASEYLERVREEDQTEYGRFSTALNTARGQARQLFGKRS